MFCGECGRATTGRPNARPTQLLPDGAPMTVAPRDTVVIDRDWLSAEFDSDPIMQPARERPTAVTPSTPDAAPPRSSAAPSRSPWDVPAWPAMPGSFTEEPAPQTTPYTRAPWAQPAAEAEPVAEPVVESGPLEESKTAVVPEPEPEPELELELEADLKHAPAENAEPPVEAEPVAAAEPDAASDAEAAAGNDRHPAPSAADAAITPHEGAPRRTPQSEPAAPLYEIVEPARPEQRPRSAGAASSDEWVSTDFLDQPAVPEAPDPITRLAPAAQAPRDTPPAPPQPGESGDTDADIDDLERTRIVRRPETGERFVLQFSTGESVMVFGSGLVGRNPLLQPGEPLDQIVVISDPSKSVSKTHLEFGQDQGSFWVNDRFSANGTIVREPETPARRCEPGRRYRIVRGTRVDIGEQFFIVS